MGFSGWGYQCPYCEAWFWGVQCGMSGACRFFEAVLGGLESTSSICIQVRNVGTRGMTIGPGVCVYIYIYTYTHYANEERITKGMILVIVQASMLPVSRQLTVKLLLRSLEARVAI